MELGTFYTTIYIYFIFIIKHIYYKNISIIAYSVFSATSLTTVIEAFKTNKIYGALNPKVRNVVSNQGNLDPWHALGLSKDLNAFAPVNYIYGIFLNNLQIIFLYYVERNLDLMV